MVGGLSYDYGIVMARCAVINNTGMIINSSAKCTRGVTNTAIFHGRYVVERFTACFTGDTCVTAGCRAIVDYPCMVETGPDETSGGMANPTILVCWYMVCGFALGEHAVMT